jgi:hypothetical protein
MRHYSLTSLAFGVVLGLAIGLMVSPLGRGEQQGQVAIWLEVVHRVTTGIGGLGTFVALIIVLRTLTDPFSGGNRRAG